MSIRTEKVASLIKRIITQPISEIANEYNAGIVTITAVKVSNDLQIAKIYLSSLNGKISIADFVRILEDNRGAIRSYVGGNIRLKNTPDLKFFIDDTLDQMEHIQKLLDSVKKKSNSK